MTEPTYASGSPTSMPSPDPVESVAVTARKVSCDGDVIDGGHPRIYMTIADGHDHVDCPYCSRRFVLQKGSSSLADSH